MLAEAEAQEICERGEIRLRFPFQRTTVEVPSGVLDEVRGATWFPSRVLRDTRVNLSAVQDESRCSQTAVMQPEDTPLTYDLWRKAALPLATRWFARFEQYFGEWFPCDRGQVIRYSRGDYFKLHNDAGWFPPDVYRVAMVAIGLTRGQEYEGGMLCFPSEGASFKLDRGDVLLFPAALRHEVLPVRDGERMVILGYFQCPMSDAHYDLYIDQFDREVTYR